jgi:uncharacterized repeat protein (TIGR04138 family)
MHHPKIAAVVQRDPRYAYEAYEFVITYVMTAARGHHVSGAELLHGIRDLALREFGLLARVVFRLWGIERTDDFGDIVFNLIDAGLLSKTDQDQRGDFHNVFDLDQALVRDYHIHVERLEE